MRVLNADPRSVSVNGLWLVLLPHTADHINPASASTLEKEDTSLWFSQSINSYHPSWNRCYLTSKGADFDARVESLLPSTCRSQTQFEY